MDIIGSYFILKLYASNRYLKYLAKCHICWLNDKQWSINCSVFISIVSAPNLCVCGRCCWQIKSLKDQYFAELSDLINRISVKLQHVNSFIPRQVPFEYYEKLKSFKIMLNHILQFLQISKSTIQPAMRDYVPQYEKQIISALNSQRRKPVQPREQQQFERPAGQAPNSNISQQHQPPQSLQEHDSPNPQASSSSMGTGLQSSSSAAFRYVPAPPTTKFSVPAHPNGATRQRQAGSYSEAAQGSNFNSGQYGSMGGALQPGSTWSMQGTMNAQPQTSMLLHNSMSTMQPNANSMQANTTGWPHIYGPRKQIPKRSWCDTLWFGFRNRLGLLWQLRLARIEFWDGSGCIGKCIR